MINESTELNKLSKSLSVDKLIQIADMHISRMFKIVDVATKGILLGRQANGREIQHITDQSDPNGLHEFYFIGSVDEVAHRLRANVAIKDIPLRPREDVEADIEIMKQRMMEAKFEPFSITLKVDPETGMMGYELPTGGPRLIEFEINDDLVLAANNLGCLCTIETLRAAGDIPSFICSQVKGIPLINVPSNERQVMIDALALELRNLKIKSKFAELISLIGTTAYDDRVHDAVKQIKLAERCLFS